MTTSERARLATQEATSYCVAEFNDGGLLPNIHHENVSPIAALLAVDDVDRRIRTVKSITDDSGLRRYVLVFDERDGSVKEALALNVSTLQIRAANLLIRTEMDMTLRSMIVGSKQGAPGNGAEDELIVPDRKILRANGRPVRAVQ